MVNNFLKTTGNCKENIYKLIVLGFDIDFDTFSQRSPKLIVNGNSRYIMFWSIAVKKTATVDNS